MIEQDLIDQLEKNDSFRVLRELDLKQTYNKEDGSEKKIAIFLDTETTGNDVEEDQIIELGNGLF